MGSNPSSATKFFDKSEGAAEWSASVSRKPWTGDEPVGFDPSTFRQTFPGGSGIGVPSGLLNRARFNRRVSVQI